MQAPQGAPSWLASHTAAERPDLWDDARTRQLFVDLWPTYNKHGTHTGTYFGALVPDRADFQVLFVDRRVGRLVARGRTIPLSWDGTLGDLPAGIDAAGLQAVEDARPPTALCALAAEVVGEYQGQGLSSLLLQAMIEAARAHGLCSLVAPVRPSWKDRYPLIPIEQYARWRRDDGLPFDPWVRVHARVGGRVVRAAPRSLEITAPVSDWQEWTGMAFPDDGDYSFPGGLAPLSVAGGMGRYWEPNVWVQHDVG